MSGSLTSDSLRKLDLHSSLASPTTESDRSLVTLVPHTTALRGSRFEVAVPVRYLKEGGFDTQGIVTVPTVKLIRSLGRLTSEQLAHVEAGVCAWLGLPHPTNPETEG